MKTIYVSACAALLAAACSPETKTAANPVPNAEKLAAGEKKYDLACKMEGIEKGEAVAHDSILHVDLTRMVYSTNDKPYLHAVNSVTNHSLVLMDDPGEWFVINRGDGSINAKSATGGLILKGTCALKPYTFIGQVF